ncbi:MAG: carboxylating nicotinate-nucleotide diphosphorylase, partial [Candidatus Omnitrophica bacterium]|nr:carboxylating nicotinate-nucleotide diphosphorylase [Candidatus Omnitrophota bacterium]
MELDKKRIDRIARYALKEDIGSSDVTSDAVIDRAVDTRAVILAREEAVVCGMYVAERVFSACDYNIKFMPMVKDGDRIHADQEIALIEGDARSILKAERTALNFLAMLSGVASRTAEFVEKVKKQKSEVKIYDTRKTIPFHRYLEKYAVTVGGGCNHRQGLWDMALIKDNHIRIFGMRNKNNDPSVVGQIVTRAKKSLQKNIKLEIEVESIKECEKALLAKPDVIMLDNMSPEMVKEAVALRKTKGAEKKVLFE